MDNIQYPVIGSSGWGTKLNNNFKEISDTIDSINDDIGAETMGTTATTIKGAIAENSAQLNAKANLATTPQILTENITYYVSPAGNDENSGLSEDSPKTLKGVIELLPRFIDSIIIINLASGTYEGNILLNGFCGTGSITINGSTASNNNDTINYIINGSVCIYNNALPIILCGLKIQETLYVTNTSTLRGGYCVLDQKVQEGLSIRTSNINLWNFTISNKNRAVYGLQSICYLEKIDGSDNIIGYDVRYCATLTTQNSTLSATTLKFTALGGEIR